VKAELRTLQVREGSYSIYVGHGILSELQVLQPELRSARILVVSDTLVASLWLPTLLEGLSSADVGVLTINPGETNKNQQTLYDIYDHLLQNHYHRDTILIALGGGVIGDITGFTAATYQRGIQFIQVPTTLLAQVDAAIGGKTAINYGVHKNMIGAFYQPAAVWSDLRCLQTLPTRVYQAGWGEIIKYGLLAGGDLWESLSHYLSPNAAPLNDTGLIDLIYQCAAIKVGFVEADVREEASRVLLNLGHTFAHALEALCPEKWLHGEAVAIGLYSAALLSYQLRLLPSSFLEKIKTMIITAGLPYQIPASLDPTALITQMQYDKKIQSGRLRFILLRRPGDCFVESMVPKDVLYDVVSSATCP